MSDDHGKTAQYDPANTSPAEGQSREVSEEARGQAPNVDPAAKDEPAEGGRDEVEDGQGTGGSGAPSGT